MFDFGDVTIPLSTAVQVWVSIVGAASGVIGYVWNWTLRREGRMQDRLDEIREASREREVAHASALSELYEKRLADLERWRTTIEELARR